MRAVAYCRVSTAKQGEGLSLKSQHERIGAFVESQGWEASYRHDAGTGSKVGPELGRTLRELDLGMFDVLVVARLDRLSRSVGNFAVILERAKAHGWKVVCLDPMVDMTTPYGEAMAGMAAGGWDLRARRPGRQKGARPGDTAHGAPQRARHALEGHRPTVEDRRPPSAQRRAVEA
jgi:hypothetical protein